MHGVADPRRACGSRRSAPRGDLVVPGTATDDPQADTHRLIPTGAYLDAHGDLTAMPGDHPRDPTGHRRPPADLPDAVGGAGAAFAEAELIRTGESVAGADLAAGTVVGERARQALAPLGALDD